MLKRACVLATVMVCVQGLAEAGGGEPTPAVVAVVDAGSVANASVNPATARVYASNSQGVAVLDGRSNRVIDSIRLPRGGGDVAFDPRRERMYVGGSAGRGSRRHPVVWVVSTQSDKVLRHVRTGEGAGAVDVNPRTDTIYTANWNPSSVTVIDGKTNKMEATVRIGNVPRGLPGIFIPHYATDLAVDSRRNLVYVATTRGVLHVIDGATNHVIQRKRVSAHDSEGFRVVVNPRTGEVIGTDTALKQVWFLTPNRRHIQRVAIPQEPQAIGLDPVRNLVFVAMQRPYDESDNPGKLEVIDGRTKRVVADLSIGDYPTDVAVDPRTLRVYIPDPDGDVLQVITEDRVQPQSSFSTSDGAVLTAGDQVTGSSTDDFSGVRQVKLSFDSGAFSRTETANLNCDAQDHLSCTWTAAAPDDPGSYLVTAQAIDRAGTVESSGPTIMIVRSPDGAWIARTPNGSRAPF